MASLYPSWIEIPADDLERAMAFYRAVFELDETPAFDDPPARIVVLKPSDKHNQRPGISLVQSPLHRPRSGGPVINFHMGDHAALEIALSRVQQCGGTLDQALIDLGDGMRYINLLDCEGNRIALSSYEDPDEF